MDAGLTVRGEEFEPELDPADMMADASGDRLGARQIRRVERNIDPVRHNVVLGTGAIVVVVVDALAGIVGDTAGDVRTGVAVAG